MRAQRIVKGLDIGENIRLSSTAGVILAQVDPFTFEAAEKVLRHSVVVGVAFAGHALPDAQRGKPAPKGFRGILDAPVTLENQARAGPLAAYGHVRRG